MQWQGLGQILYSSLKSKLLVGHAVLTYIVHSGSADLGEWDNLVPPELAELADIPTVFAVLFLDRWTRTLL
jgi:hypothetical protein